MAYGERFGRQVRVLLLKNVKQLRRNLTSTVCRLGACVFFMALAKITLLALTAAINNEKFVRAEPHPDETRIMGIPKCGLGRGCLAFAYTPAPTDGFIPSKDDLDGEDVASWNTFASANTVDAFVDEAAVKRAHSIVRHVIKNNQDKALAPTQVMGFTTEKALDDYITTHLEKVEAGVIIVSPTPAKTSFFLELNTTKITSATDRAYPLHIAFTKAIAFLFVVPGSEIEVDISIQPFAHPKTTENPDLEDKEMLSLFILMSSMFPFVIQMSEVVQEREKKLRQSMETMGMLDCAYWTSWHLFHMLIGFVGAMVLCICGHIFQFRTFTHNDFGVMLFTFFFFTLAMSGLGYFISTLLRTSFAAIVIGLGFSLFALIMWVVCLFGLPYGVWPHTGSPFYMNCTAHALFKTGSNLGGPGEYWPSNSTGIDMRNFRREWRECSAVPPDLEGSYNWTREIMQKSSGYQSLPVIFSLLPMGLLAQDLTSLGNMASNQTQHQTGKYGLRMGNVSSYCETNLTTGVLCDKDYSVGSSWGIFFGIYLFYSVLALWLDNVLPDAMGMRKPPWYFLLPAYWGAHQRAVMLQQRPEVLEGEQSEDQDVLAEEARVLANLGTEMDPQSAIEVRGLRMSFRRNGKPFHAVKSPFFAMRKRTLFALLGPNGAGKTTTINMLTGLLNPSAGEALIATSNGTKSITCATDMGDIRNAMGICPQFDILWENLSAREHLEIFATLKGVPPANVSREGDLKLEQVSLTDAADVWAGSFSGGMKRRLSVAIALIGNPEVVYLDEPTTGMDPISRRQVWDVIEEAKQDRAVVLTTHSMEEADILGDTIGIMAKGRLRCLGGPVHLKSRFGAGYRLMLTLSASADRDKIKGIVSAALEGEVVLEEEKMQLTIVLKSEHEDSAPALFSQLEDSQQELGIDDLQVAMSSLEDVFLDVVKSAEAQEEKNVTVTLCTGETVLVKQGGPSVVTPSGVEISIQWELDADGHLVYASSKPATNSTTAQMMVTVPEGVSGGGQVSVGGVLVTVPEGLSAGQTFIADIPAAGPHSVSVHGPGDAGTVPMSEQDLEARVAKLSSSFSSQSRAIFNKTWALQKKKCCTNFCLCTCPSLSLVLVFMFQWIFETFLFPDLTPVQRCTYCGPSTDSFGKSYCGGKKCEDYFFPIECKGVQCKEEDNWQECSTDGFARQWKEEWMRGQFESKQDSALGVTKDDGWLQLAYEESGYMAMPSPTQEIDLVAQQFAEADENKDNIVSFDEWSEWAVAKILETYACELRCDTCVKSQRAKCADIAATCGGNGNVSCFWPQAEGSRSLSCSHLQLTEAQDGIRDWKGVAYKQPRPLPFLYAPQKEFLSKTPVAFTAKDPAKAAKILDRVYPRPFENDRLNTSKTWLLNQVWTILMLPRLGCGKMAYTSGPRNATNGTNTSAWIFEPVGASATLSLPFNETVQSALCKLIQHGAASPRPCCLELGNIAGMEQARSTVEFLFDKDFADLYVAELQKIGGGVKMANACVQPVFDRVLDAKLPRTTTLGLDASLTVIARHFSLPLDTVHPQLEARSIPECTAEGNCATPQGKWSLACHDFLQKRMDIHDTNDLAKFKCGAQNGQEPPCSTLTDVSSFLRVRSEPRCSCVDPGTKPADLSAVEQRWCSKFNSDTPDSTRGEKCCMVEEVQDANGSPMFDMESSVPSKSCDSSRASFGMIENDRGAGGGSTWGPCLCIFQLVLPRLAAKGFGWEIDWRDNFVATDLPRFPGVPRSTDDFAAFLPFGSPNAALATAGHHAEASGAIYSGWGQTSNWVEIEQSPLPFAADESFWYRGWDRFATCECFKNDAPCLVFSGPGCSINQSRPWEDRRCEYDEECRKGCRRSRYTMNNASMPSAGWRKIRQCSGQPNEGQCCEGENCEEECWPWDRGRDGDDSMFGYRGFSVLSPDCDADGIQIFSLLFNATRSRFDCVSVQEEGRLEVKDHNALDDAVFRGFGKKPDDAGVAQALVGAFDFKDTKDNQLHMTLMYNDSGMVRDDIVTVQTKPRRDRHLTALNRVLRAFLAERAGVEAVESQLLLGLKSFPASPPWGSPVDLGSELGPFFFSFTFAILFPGIVATFVQEKAARIRIMMKMMGLGWGAFWLITWCFWFLIYFCFALIFLTVTSTVPLPTSGYKIGMFQNVNHGIQFLFYLFYCSTTISFAFLWGTVISNLRTAQVLSFLWIFLLITLCYSLDAAAGVFDSDGVPASLLDFLTLFPPIACFRGFNMLRAYKDSFSNPYTDDTFMTFERMPQAMKTVLIILALEGPIFLALAMYLDQVLDTGFGIPRHPLFFLGFDKEEGEVRAHAEEVAGGAKKPDDVLEEEARVAALEGKPLVEQDAVRTKNLIKIYAAAGGNPPKMAVRDLTLGIRRGECFGMLGPNGAGKTSSINMLIGLARPTEGDAWLEGFSIVTHMHKIYSIMGVCPQHDILWDLLSPREHLTFYGQLKNLHGTELEEEIKTSLKAVNLLDVINTRSGTFSGGMKRRLSVAISLIGSPLVCFLDEPSTGLDPASRRLLWQCIENAKRSRAILLTTHSMEEAKGLCDRLGIFVDGQLRCIGEPLDLTRRFGGIFILTITAETQDLHSNLQKIDETVAKTSEHKHKMTYSLAATVKYELPAGAKDPTTGVFSGARLSQVFAAMRDLRKQRLISSWGVSSCTLEDAFIKISQNTVTMSAAKARNGVQAEATPEQISTTRNS